MYFAFGRSGARENCGAVRFSMLHSDLFPEFGCDGELIELPNRIACTLEAPLAAFAQNDMPLDRCEDRVIRLDRPGNWE